MVVHTGKNPVQTLRCNSLKLRGNSDRNPSFLRCTYTESRYKTGQVDVWRWEHVQLLQTGNGPGLNQTVWTGLHHSTSKQTAGAQTRHCCIITWEKNKTHITCTSLKHTLILKLSLGVMGGGVSYLASLGPSKWSGHAGSVPGCSAPQGVWVEWRGAAWAPGWRTALRGFYTDHLTGRSPETDCGETRSANQRHTCKISLHFLKGSFEPQLKLHFSTWTRKMEHPFQSRRVLMDAKQSGLCSAHFQLHIFITGLLE